MNLQDDIATGIQSSHYEVIQEIFDLAGGTSHTHRKPFASKPANPGVFRKGISLIRAQSSMDYNGVEITPNKTKDIQEENIDSRIPYPESGGHWFASLSELRIDRRSLLPAGVTRVENAEDLREVDLAGDGAIILPEREEELPEGVKRHNSAKNDPSRKKQRLAKDAHVEDDSDVQPAYLSGRVKRGKQKYRNDSVRRATTHHKPR